MKDIGPEPDWYVVVPVKGGPAAKTRLHPPAGVSRWSLAYAVAEDCLRAVTAAIGEDRLVIVTGDEAVADLAAQIGACVVGDPGGGLDAAVGAGVTSVLRRAGDAAAVLLGDLPALHADDLTAALAAAANAPRAVVPDREGTGTVLLTAHGTGLRGRMPTAFGPGSAAAHAELGYQRLELDLPRLRTDVDDDASLWTARGLGVGPATTAVLAPPVGPPRQPG